MKSLKDVVVENFSNKQENGSLFEEKQLNENQEVINEKGGSTVDFGKGLGSADNDLIKLISKGVKGSKDFAKKALAALAKLAEAESSVLEALVAEDAKSEEQINKSKDEDEKEEKEDVKEGKQEDEDCDEGALEDEKKMK